jgi:hypothetical protein
MRCRKVGSRNLESSVSDKSASVVGRNRPLLLSRTPSVHPSTDRAQAKGTSRS